MFCYVDDIESYSTNEVAINWNSALAWVASFLADQGDARRRPPAACTVRYTDYGAWPDGTGFTGQVTVTNTGTTTVDGWTRAVRVHRRPAGARGVAGEGTQAGATVTARNESYNARIEPGGTVMFGFNATTAGGANPHPGLFTVNGAACSLT